MRNLMRARRNVARAVVFAAVAVAAGILGAGTASAAITTPGNGATVRGTVTISENSGGQDNCVFGNSGDNTRIEVRQGSSGGPIVLNLSKGDGGGYTVSWATINVNQNGAYRVRSFGRNITNGFFSCNTGSEYLISDIGVTLDNRSFLSYTGSTGGVSQNSVPVSANLSLEGGAGNVGGRTVVFSLSGQPGTVSATTNGSGVASALLPITRGAGAATVTAAYGGDGFFSSSASSAGFAVSTRVTSLAYIGATSGYWTETETLAARLVDVQTGAPVGGKTVSFSVGSVSGSAGTNAAGIAQLPATLNDTPGNYSVSASFSGDAVYGPSSGSATMDILKRPTMLTVVGDSDGYWDENARLAARLVDVRNGNPIGGKNIVLSLGSISVTATTDAGGVAEESELLFDPAGTYPMAGTFAEDANYRASTGAAPFTILRRPVTLTYNGDANVFWNEDAAFSAILTDDRRAAGVAGKTVSFAMGGNSMSVTTGAGGLASATATVSDLPGNYGVDSAFAGDQFYVPAADQDAFEVLKRPTSLTYDGAVQGFRGHTVTLSATLSDVRAAGGLGGKTVHFALGSFAADAVTGANGTATVDALLDQDPGAYTVDVSFDEDAGYLGSSDSEAFTLDWEYVFDSAIGSPGTVNINVSTREWQFVSGSDDSGIVSDPGMIVIKAPDDFQPPAPPCDPNTPAGCIPEPCVDDPEGGDPICPMDYLPGVQGAVEDEACVDDPMGGDPICLPEAPPAPCDPNDPSSCGVPEPPSLPCDDAAECMDLVACTLPMATGCSDRFVLLAFSGPADQGSITIAGLFDLKTGIFASVVATDAGVYAMASLAGNEPAPPCDANDPSSCGVPEAPDVPDVPEVPEVPEPPCDPNAPEGCVPAPPAPPCDPTVDPEACVPEPPAARI